MMPVAHARRPQESLFDAVKRTHRQSVTRRIARKALVPAFYANLAVVVALFVQTGGVKYLGTSAEWFSTTGSLSGFIATNMILIQLLLMSRASWINGLVGMDELTIWHRRVGRVAFSLLAVHVITIIIGYALTTRTSVFHEVRVLLLETRDVLMATVAMLLIVVVVVTSIRKARRRMQYETWFFVHLYAYLAVALAVPHQIFAGTHFATTTLARVYWIAVYAFTVGSLLWCRIIKPVVNMLRHDLHVHEVIDEGSDATSIVVRGRNLDLMDIKAGQFFVWRFLARNQWWQAHPYSLSAAPRHNELRVTVKALGDGSASLRNLRSGTRVLAEGPFGLMTTEARQREHVLLIAGGIGITPIRSLAESFPPGSVELTILYRVHDVEDFLFRNELLALANRRGARLQFVAGSRDEFPADMQPLSPIHLLAVAPDIRSSDVYVCGPVPMVTEVLKSVQQLRVPESQIHAEMFSFAS